LILEKIAILGQPPGGCALHTNQNPAQSGAFIFFRDPNPAIKQVYSVMPDLPAAGRLDSASSVFLDRSLRLPPAFAGMTIFRYLIAGVISHPMAGKKSSTACGNKILLWTKFALYCNN